VSFGSWRPTIVWLGGVQRLAFAEPSWAHVEPEEVLRLICENLDVDR
jgi:hypothetical protein